MAIILKSPDRFLVINSVGLQILSTLDPRE